jgi:hypothetical protein
MTHTYSLYVGTTPTHDAHGAPIVALPRDLAYGVWNGETEAIAIYELRARDDAAAARSAAALAIATGSEAILVARDASPTGIDARDSRYRVRAYVTNKGDRTLYPADIERGIGYTFRPDHKGNEVAWLTTPTGEKFSVDGAPDMGCDWRERMPEAADYAATPSHECHVDCEPFTTATGGNGHEMYPAEPNRSAGRYQAELNLAMTRREYRASGQDESRNVRVWNARRATRVASLGGGAVGERVLYHAGGN